MVTVKGFPRLYGSLILDQDHKVVARLHGDNGWKIAGQDETKINCGARSCRGRECFSEVEISAEKDAAMKKKLAEFAKEVKRHWVEVNS
jgi:hypothetical protein